MGEKYTSEKSVVWGIKSEVRFLWVKCLWAQSVWVKVCG